jgi:hypothetical protein
MGIYVLIKVSIVWLKRTHPSPSQSPTQEETLRLVRKVIVLSLCREKWNRLLIVTQRQHKYPYNVITQWCSADGPQATSCI